MELYKIYDDTTKELVAIIKYDTKTNKFESELIIPELSPILFATFNGEKFLIGDCPHPPSECIEYWLKDRVIPENRDMLKETLAKFGIYEYNWRELIKLNHGRSVTDDFSVEVEEVEDEHI